MFEAVKTRVVSGKVPTSGVVRKGPVVMTAHIPKDPVTGQIVTGDIVIQTRRTLENLRMTMEDAGGSLADVMFIQVFLVNASDAPGMNSAWREFFSEPFPGRATVVVKELLAPGATIEIAATAFLGAI
jgi:enamine deaminase RidA (YjgF/YER057c/UK114 family)